MKRQSAKFITDFWQCTFGGLLFTTFPTPFHINIRPGHQLVDDNPGARLLLVLGPRDLDELLLPLGLGVRAHI